MTSTSSASTTATQSLDLKLDVEQAKADLHLVDPATLQEEKIDPEVEAKATQMADLLASIDPNDFDARADRKRAVEDAGRELQKEASHRSGMLRQPIKTLAERGEDGGEVGKALVDLKIHMEELDPTELDFSPGWLSRTMGFLPFVGTPLKRYFTQYESAQTVIDAIVNSLIKGRDQLKRDSTTLAEDQRIMRDLTLRLQKQIQLLMRIDEKLGYKLEREIPADDARHTFISDELLFPLRQRIQDLQQQLVVNQQGVLAVEIIVRNNKELIRGVNRAVEVTVSALQVAVAVALALANQRIVLDKVDALNETTTDLIAGTAQRLRTQGAEIHKQASESMLDIETLKTAFIDINMAMDEISRFRQEALPTMAANILELNQLSAAGEEAITRMEQGNQARPALQLELT